MRSLVVAVDGSYVGSRMMINQNSKTATEGMFSINVLLSPSFKKVYLAFQTDVDRQIAIIKAKYNRLKTVTAKQI